MMCRIRGLKKIIICGMWKIEREMFLTTLKEKKIRKQRVVDAYLAISRGHEAKSDAQGETRKIHRSIEGGRLFT